MFYLLNIHLRGFSDSSFKPKENSETVILCTDTLQKCSNCLRLTCRDLGHIASGMSCDFLRLWTNETDFAELLRFVSKLSEGPRPALVRNKFKHLSNSPLRLLMRIFILFYLILLHVSIYFNATFRHSLLCVTRENVLLRN